MGKQRTKASGYRNCRARGAGGEEGGRGRRAAAAWPAFRGGTQAIAGQLRCSYLCSDTGAGRPPALYSRWAPASRMVVEEAENWGAEHTMMGVLSGLPSCPTATPPRTGPCCVPGPARQERLFNPQHPTQVCIPHLRREAQGCETHDGHGGEG